MKTLEHRYVDKSEWGDGPWMTEPDKLQWQDEATKLPCLIVRGSGALCGYVGVSKGHPYFGREYQYIEDDIEIHGGLTYTNKCQYFICHEVEEGEDENVWWIGFDCAHAGDYLPGAHNSFLDGIYRDISYVKAEVKELARQLHEIQ